MPQLVENQVLIGTDPQPRLIRLLWFEPARIAAQRVAAIELVRSNRLPEWYDRTELEVAIDEGAFLIAAIDTHAARVVPEGDLSETERASRDERYSIIQSLVTDPDYKVLYKEFRGSEILRAAALHNCSPKHVRHLLGLYWQRGQTPNALLPDFAKRGGRGSRATERAHELPKRGRPRKASLGKDEHKGINVNERTRKLLVLGAERFQEKLGMPPKEAYDKTIRTYFACGWMPDTDGTLIPLLLPENERPSFPQYHYHYEISRKPREAIQKKKGVRRFLLENRPLLGTSKHLAPGPGALYLIDSTRADIVLRSSLRKSRTIGSPWLYVVRDLFSRMIVGFYICLEGPNWAGIKMALQSVLEDKVSFCRKLGREITPEEWPCAHIPGAMLGDRGPGEILSANADFMINNFFIRIDTAAPSRPDWKAVIERVFRFLNESYSWEPGAIHGPRQRGDADHRLDAVHTLESFTLLFLEIVLQYNNYYWLESYEPDQDVLWDEVPLIPRELWNWGVKNRQGALRSVPDMEHVRRTLMRSVEATVTRHGIWVPDLKLHYTCPTAVKEDWFVVERGRKRQKVELALEDWDVAEAYLRLDRGRIVERCQLLPRYEQFSGRSRDEVLDERAWQRVLARDANRELQQGRAGHQHRRDRITAEQIAERVAAKAAGEGRMRIGTREDRLEERDRQRAETLVVQRTGTEEPNRSAPPKEHSDEPVPAASELALLKDVESEEEA